MVNDEPLLGRDYYRVHFFHTDLGTRHWIDVVVPFYSLQAEMSGGEGYAQRVARRAIQDWRTRGVVPEKLAVNRITHQRREFCSDSDDRETEFRGSVGESSYE